MSVDAHGVIVAANRGGTGVPDDALEPHGLDLTLAEQHAREQIARTLHDGLQQMLVVAL